MKKYALIFLGLIVLWIVASYAYDQFRVSRGKACLERYIELEKTRSARLVDLYADDAKVIVRRLYEDKKYNKTSLMTGAEYKTFYPPVLKERTPDDIDQYSDIKAEIEDNGDVKVTSKDFNLKEQIDGDLTLILSDVSDCTVTQSAYNRYMPNPPEEAQELPPEETVQP